MTESRESDSIKKKNIERIIAIKRTKEQRKKQKQPRIKEQREEMKRKNNVVFGCLSVVKANKKNKNLFYLLASLDRNQNIRSFVCVEWISRYGNGVVVVETTERFFFVLTFVFIVYALFS